MLNPWDDAKSPATSWAKPRRNHVLVPYLYEWDECIPVFVLQVPVYLFDSDPTSVVVVALLQVMFIAERFANFLHDWNRASATQGFATWIAA